jgi:4-methylaminobutanoate oxidase (formaldehyde-forming)
LGPDFAFSLLNEDWDHFEPMMFNALHRIPALETAEVRTLLNGPESFTPDGSFLLGETAEVPGLFLGCGMNSVGVATGGGAGWALAHWVVEGHPPFHLGEADPMRFPAQVNRLEALMSRAPEVLGKHYEIAYPGRQFESARFLRESPLQSRWKALGARFGQVYGWERPLYFGASEEPVLTFGRPAWHDQVGREVAAALERAALFDLSTFGKLRVSGPDAEAFLDRLCSNDMTRTPGSVLYTALLNEHGGFESDLTALRLDNESYLLYVGSDAVKRDFVWLSRHRLPDESVAIEDVTEDLAVLGLMGPAAVEIVQQLGGTLDDIPYFRHRDAELAGVPLRAARLSYVGEAGWELTCKSADALALLDALLDAGAKPAGLYAQTSMRIEKRFLAMGHDLDSDITPYEAGLDFLIKKRGGFLGAEALAKRQEEPLGKRLVSILLDDPTACPLGDEPVYCGKDLAGQVTSAAFGHRIGRPVALAYLCPKVLHDMEGAKVQLDIAGIRYAGRTTLKAAFDPEGERMKGRGPT